MLPPTDTATKQSAAPERSLNQRMDALERANVVRTKRAALKRDLKAGRCSIQALLTDPPEYLETAKVFDMLLAVPKYGRVKVNKVLTQCRISPSKTIGGLSQRQRDELVKLLRR
ncbi:MAG: integration host factor, actinobacterial type [Solirubrobacteraceae bacterium]